MNNEKKKIARLICLMLCLMMVMWALPACGSSSEDEDDYSDYTEETADDVSDVSDDAGTTDTGYTGEESIDISSLAGEGGVEVDLTKLSATMVYSVVNDMMVRPNEYEDKVVRMNGIMSVYHDENTGNTYYACIIQDATACCSQGIEFKTTNGEYPEEGENVTVKGTYGVYDEDGIQYSILNDAVVED